MISDITGTAPVEQGYAHAVAAWYAHAAATGHTITRVGADGSGRDQVTMYQGPGEHRVWTLVPHVRDGQITVEACRRPSEIPTQLEDYPLLWEVLGDIPGLGREQAHAGIQRALAEHIALRGEEVVYARRDQTDAAGRVVGQWVTVDEDSYRVLAGAVQLWAEDDLGHLVHRLDEREDDIEVEVRHYRGEDIARLVDGEDPPGQE